MDKEPGNKALKYESDFEYSKGLINTPKKWIGYFWDHYYKTIKPYLSGEISKCNKVIFVGIGSGDIVPMLSDEDKAKITGLDINFKSLINAAEHAKVVLADAANLPFKSNSVDLVICNQVLHHIIGQGSLAAAIKECHRVIRNGGRFIAIEPNAFHPSGALMNIANRFHKYNLLTGGSDYEFALSPLHVVKLLKENNFSIEKNSAITFSHPRFPIFMQKLIHLFDNRLSNLYLAGLINMHTAVKTT